MVSHDCVAFYLLSQQVAKHVTVVQSGQGADEVLAGYEWYPPLAGVDSDPATALAAYRAEFFDRDHDDLAGILDRRWLAPDDPSGAFAAEHFAPARRGHRAGPGAAAGLAGDAGRRPGQTGRQHDDGLGSRSPGAVPGPRVRRTLRGGAAGAEAGRWRQGRAEGGVPAAAAGRGDRPDQGSLPGAGDHRAWRASTWIASGTRCRRRRPRERGLFHQEYVDALLAEPNARRTRLGSNQLWQIGLLELWLQQHGIR